ncbi:hypothetical protein B0H14DRAFT_2610776 [Mycena olivaceomarginata]|nr:hypothetical protein B0H14DRAFT_2610776 [Mycena olivaceomarginata]
MWSPRSSGERYGGASNDRGEWQEAQCCTTTAYNCEWVVDWTVQEMAMSRALTPNLLKSTRPAHRGSPKHSTSFVRLLNPTTALSEDSEISQNLTRKNSCNSPKKAMSLWASFREPKYSTNFVRLLNPTTALSKDCQDISQNSTLKNSCNSLKKAMGLWAFFWEPKTFHKFCVALESDGCVVGRLSGDFTKFNPEELSQQSQKGNESGSAFPRVPNIPQIL